MHNRSKTLIPDAAEVIRIPSVAEWLDGVALRDLALHRDHAACVDAKGDVYQWGTQYSGSNIEKTFKPTLTLREKVSSLHSMRCITVYDVTYASRISSNLSLQKDVFMRFQPLERYTQLQQILQNGNFCQVCLRRQVIHGGVPDGSGEKMRPLTLLKSHPLSTSLGERSISSARSPLTPNS